MVDLQLELDEQREKNEASSKGSGSKRKQDMRIKYLEDKLEKTLNFHDQVVNERSSLRMELQLAEKKLSIRNDRIAHLEKVTFSVHGEKSSQSPFFLQSCRGC